ncbi:FAD-dependent oxidoreductase [Adlercreutzia sp. R25]|uniref:FAD-dependent oxidoreductase n=1 Tax=Adlercreutzia shanghongiae TaxID=3111773 RepID=A0ABU6IY04_9ACTN|nr:MULTISPECIES: FAD-dependent oxidoreductase [unclassified Adlercreutzia]MEC4271732.1 FAD-dependent oxidoreductase [Adlercreutzia sp. R25]MEC4294739.1 FAD-dependent oxidoreductase [Adlercreutzia sp. R22]
MTDFTRRNFFKAAGVFGGIAAVSGLAGCAPQQTGAQNDLAETGAASESSNAPAYDIAETKDCDIVVVGGGMSGLAAAVSASEEGHHVVLIEANTNTGGNGHGTEGIFACGSSLQKELGINFTFEDVIAEEFNFFNYLIDALAWKDLVEASADNVDWLASNGVLFDGVDNYRGQGKLDAFHWYAGGAAAGYIEPMTAKAEAQGVEILYSTRGRELVTDNGRVCGIVAEAKDGSYVQINAKGGVILATGGYADNDDKLREMGINPDRVARKGFPCHEGDGLDMAVAVGGVDERNRRCVMREPGTRGCDFESALGALAIRNGGPVMYVNQNGERFTNENAIVHNDAFACNCILKQKSSFTIANDAILAAIDANVPPIVDNLSTAAAAALSEEGAGVFKADTIEELAAQIGVEGDKLASELAHYNELCQAGRDTDFGKEPEALVAMESGPFWAFEHGLFYFSTIGGIKTNRSFEVCDADDEPIAGLWAVGTDGCNLYGDTYTVMMPASCMANNINSGRCAGRAAIDACSA